MRIYRHKAFVEDTWKKIGDEEAIGEDSGNIVVSLARWRAEPDLATRANVGVLLRPGDEPGDDANALTKVPLIVITFAKFTDGRGYSIARLLRERYGFQGEIRATGEVLLDQIPLMLRCGFDAFEIVHGPTIASLERGHLPEIAYSYQRPTGSQRRYSTAVRSREGAFVTTREHGNGAGHA